MDDTARYYDCNCAKNVRNRFNVFKQNFQIIVDDLLSYKKDIRTLIAKSKKEETILSNVLLEQKRKLDLTNKGGK